MTSITDFINTSAGVVDTSTTTTTPEDSGDIMGKEGFLSLLVAQLQNQDPLNPDEPTEFTAQLAQFSSLEQLTNINESMESLVTATSNSDRMSTLSTMGKDVVYYGSEFNYSGEPVELGYKLDGDATNVTLTIQQNGTTYATIKGSELTEGTHYLTWDGTMASGQQAPTGDYKISITAKAASGDSVGSASIIRSEVTGVDIYGENGGLLITENGEVDFFGILGVYESGASMSTDTDNDSEDEESASEVVTDALDTVDEITETVENISDTVEQS